MELLYHNVGVAKSVPIEVRAKLIPSWTKLLDAVAVAMVIESVESSPVMNELVAMVLDKLVKFFEQRGAEVSVAFFIQSLMLWLMQIYMLCALTKMCLLSIDHVNFTKGSCYI